MGVRVVTDSSADLSPEQARDLGIEVVPLKVRFGAEEFADGVDLTPAAFWERLRSSRTLPQTAAPSPGDFEAAFGRLMSEGASGIVCVTLSSKVSATFQAARLAAEAVASRCRVAVVDSLTVSAGLGNLCRRTARRAADGADLESLVAHATDCRDRSSLYGAVATLEYLRRGGRIGTARAVLGAALSIQPLLRARQGIVDLAAMVRTRLRALTWIADRLEADRPVESVTVFHAEARDLAAFVDMVSARVPGQEVDVSGVGPVLGTHVGPGTVGVSYFRSGG